VVGIFLYTSPVPTYLNHPLHVRFHAKKGCFCPDLVCLCVNSQAVFSPIQSVADSAHVPSLSKKNHRFGLPKDYYDLLSTVNNLFPYRINQTILSSPHPHQIRLVFDYFGSGRLGFFFFWWSWVVLNRVKVARKETLVNDYCCRQCWKIIDSLPGVVYVY